MPKNKVFGQAEGGIQKQKVFRISRKAIEYELCRQMKNVYTSVSNLY